jgi:hypothetical protein
VSIASCGIGREVAPGRAKRYADTRVTAEYIGVSVQFLEKNRVSGKDAIPYIKLGRKVLYDLDVIDRVMAENARVTTSEIAA